MVATLIKEYDHSPALSANFEGSVQTLSDGDVVLGWGQQPYLSEVNPAGQQTFDARFTVATSTYRAYRFPWSAQPPTAPALALAPNGDGSTELFASWNGATDVASWRVLAGGTPAALAPVGGAARRGFETAIRVRSAGPYFAVQALGSAGLILTTSVTQASPAHIALYGGSAFVSASGFGGVPASCLAAHPCQITTTVSAGRKVIARTGAENLAPGRAGILHFHLSRAGQIMLQQARSKRLAVQFRERDSSGLTAMRKLTLVPYSTSGKGPHRSVVQAPALHILALTDFVSKAGVGGILAACTANTACLVKTTISLGANLIARTETEVLGAGEAGYLTFSLTPTGRRMLAGAPGNQLSVHVTLAGAGPSASGQLALVRFT